MNRRLWCMDAPILLNLRSLTPPPLFKIRQAARNIKRFFSAATNGGGENVVSLTARR
jgi:hypothetical protein